MTKNILITGSTDGIGKITALMLAKDGHDLFLHGRNKAKLDNTISELKSISNNQNIKGFVADFSDFDAIKSMAKIVNSELNSLDVLINNAGVFKSPEVLTKDGLDLRYMVNYFAPYLLTHSLIPLLKKSQSPRVINLSSAAQSSIDTDTLMGKKTQSLNETYAQSKLALTMWSFDLASAHKEMTTIAVNPGSLLDTNMVKEAYGHHWSSADKGANILYDLATSDKHLEKSGLYFDNDRGSYGPAHKDAYDQNKIKRLLESTAKILSNNLI